MVDKNSAQLRAKTQMAIGRDELNAAIRAGVIAPEAARALWAHWKEEGIAGPVTAGRRIALADAMKRMVGANLLPGAAAALLLLSLGILATAIWGKFGTIYLVPLVLALTVASAYGASYAHGKQHHGVVFAASIVVSALSCFALFLLATVLEIGWLRPTPTRDVFGSIPADSEQMKSAMSILAAAILLFSGRVYEQRGLRLVAKLLGLYGLSAIIATLWGFFLPHAVAVAWAQIAVSAGVAAKYETLEL